MKIYSKQKKNQLISSTDITNKLEWEKAKRSKEVLDVSDPNFKAFPAHAKNNIMFMAICSFANARDCDRETLYNIGRAMNSLPEATMISCPIAVSPRTC